jgi:DNA-binding transcriptional MerR regulator
MFFEEIKTDIVQLQHLLTSDAKGIMKYHELFASRRFYVGDTGINRKTLKAWESAGLLPYLYEGEGWRKFSFLEWVWLECINEFRQLGVSLEKIKEIKKILFDVDADEFFDMLKQELENYDGQVDQKDNIMAAYNHPELTYEIRAQAINELQFSPFLFILYSLILTERNYCIVYNNENYCSFFLMGVGDEMARKVNEEVFPNLTNNSFVALNLRKVTNKIFNKPELRHNDSFIIDFLMPKEKKIFDHIRSSNAKEIIISFNDNNEPTHIKVNRNQISKETLAKVARYLRSGNYQTVEFTTRDGHLIKYEEQDSIRL